MLSANYNLLHKLKIMKILFITLSNIGDAVMTLPALDSVIENNKNAQITVLTGTRPKEIFENNPAIHEVIIFDKRASFKEQLSLFNRLNKEKFDQVIDLRNSFFGILLSAKKKINPFKSIPKSIKHMKDRHLFRAGLTAASDKAFFLNNALVDNRMQVVLKTNNINEEDGFIIVSAGARSTTKTWPQENFQEFIERFIDGFKLKVVLVGDNQDKKICEGLLLNSKYPLVDLCGKTNIFELAALIKKSKLVVGNDSAVLHIASYLNIPTLAIFGPTDDIKYGPWSDKGVVVKKEIFCRPCRKAQCIFGNLNCLKSVRPIDVLRGVENILKNMPLLKNYNYKRILVARTDRIGDVLLSTPVFEVLRQSYPNAYIAALVSPYAQDIVRGNPFIDEVIVYDKDGLHKSIRSSIKFSLWLKSQRFDLALILHPINRMHLITYFAGIPQRIGYDRKLSLFLTDKIKHTKQLGQKHEMEYALDLVRYLGIEPKKVSLYMPVSRMSQEKVQQLLINAGISNDDKILAIHPSASCPSKIWPAGRFAEVCDALVEKYAFKVLVVASSKDYALAQQVVKDMKHQAINLAGKTSVGELAALLKRSSLFISNDSGPVHIAWAVGTPVIAIFGRNQKGLSPLRWGPRGLKDRILHKQVGCIECLAHNCKKDYLCLKSINTAEVIQAAEDILGKNQ